MDDPLIDPLTQVDRVPLTQADEEYLYGLVMEAVESLPLCIVEALKGDVVQKLPIKALSALPKHLIRNMLPVTVNDVVNTVVLAELAAIVIPMAVSEAAEGVTDPANLSGAILNHLKRVLPF